MIKIIQDTREKEPWILSDAQLIEKLDAGDYAIHNSLLIIIERKKSPAELSRNLGMYRERFERELEKMTTYELRYVVCEFSYDDMLKFPRNAKIPKYLKRKIKMNGRYMAKIISELVDTYEVEFIFCNDRQEANQTAIELIENAQISTS